MKVLTAILVSLGLHGLLAALLAACLEAEPESEVLVALDLSSVELSFAETLDESAAAAPARAAAASDEAPERVTPAQPDENARPDGTEPAPKPEPPELSAPRFPEPEPEAFARLPETPPKAQPDQSQSQPSTSSAAAPAPRQARIDADPQPRRSIRPEYPRGAKERREQGDVVVEFRVSASGEVERAAVAASCGYPEIDAAAVRAVRKASFRPARSGSKAVAATARITLSFRLK